MRVREMMHFFGSLMPRRLFSENRLVGKKLDVAEAIAEKIASTREVGEAIDANIAMNRERYGRFEKGTGARAVVLAVAKYRETKNPSVIGGGINKANISLVANNQEVNAAVVEARRSAEKTLLRKSAELMAKAKETYEGRIKGMHKERGAAPNVYKILDRAPGALANAADDNSAYAYDEVNPLRNPAEKLEEGRAALESATALQTVPAPIDLDGVAATPPVPFVFDNTQPEFAGFLGYYEKLMEKPAVTEPDITTFKTDHSSNLQLWIIQVSENLKRSRQDVANNRSRGRMDSPAQAYIGFLEQYKIPALQDYQAFLLQAFTHLQYVTNALTYGKEDPAKSPTEVVEEKNQNVEKITEQIEETERRLATERRKGDDGFMVPFLEAQLTALHASKDTIEYGYRAARTGAADYASRALEALEQGKAGGTDKNANVALILDEYLAVTEAFERAGIRPKDRRTYDMLVAAAMLHQNGIEAVLDTTSGDVPTLQAYFSGASAADYKFDPATFSELVGLADFADVPLEDLQGIDEDIQHLRMEKEGTFEAMAKNMDVDWNSAFDTYFRGGDANGLPWSHGDPETSVGNWKNDLLKKIQASDGANAHAVKILRYIMPQTDGNRAFLDSLQDPSADPVAHQKALQLLDGLVEDFQRQAKFKQEEVLRMGSLEDALSEGGGTVTEKVMGTARKVVGGMFDSSLPVEKRIMYGAAAYMFIFKGVFGKGPLSKLAKLGTGAAIAAMLAEDAFGVQILGFAGVESPDELSKGTAFNAMVNRIRSEGIDKDLDANDKPTWRAHEILFEKNVADVLVWYKGKEKLGELSPMLARQKGVPYSVHESLKKARLLSAGELAEIDENPDTAANTFLKAVEDELAVFGTEWTDGTTQDRSALVKAGYDLTYHFFTREGVGKTIEEGPYEGKMGSELLSPAMAAVATSGNHEPTWYEAASAFTTAHRVEEAMQHHEGLSWLKAGSKELMDTIWEKIITKGYFRIAELVEGKAEQVKEVCWQEYGEPGLEAIQVYFGRGMRFAREKKDELEVWWEGEGGLRLRRIGNNLWEVAGTAVSAPVISTVSLLDKTSGNLRDLFVRMETQRKEWSDNTHEIDFALFPYKGGVNALPADVDPKAEKTYHEAALLMNRVAYGYEIFGKYEHEFLQVSFNRKPKKGQEMFPRAGMLAENDFMTEPDVRVRMNEHEGYLCFAGLGPKGNSEAAFSEGVQNAIRFLRGHMEAIDQSSPEGIQFAEAVRSGNPDLQREHIIKYVRRFGAYETQHEGHIGFYFLPFPPASEAPVYNKQELQPDGKMKPVRTPVENRNLYAQMTHGEHRQENFDQFKHTLRFSSSTDPLKEGYLETTPKGGPNLKGFWMQRYMDEFGLWDFGDVTSFLGGGMGRLDSVSIPEYGKGDSKRAALFQAMLKHRDKLMREQHDVFKEETLYGRITKFCGKAAADQYRKSHKYLKDYFISRGLTGAVSDFFGDEGFYFQYRDYLNKELASRYREKGRGAVSNPKIIRDITAKFVEEKSSEVGYVIERVGSGLKQGGQGLDWLLNQLKLEKPKPLRDIGD